MNLYFYLYSGIYEGFGKDNGKENGNHYNKVYTRICMCIYIYIDRLGLYRGKSPEKDLNRVEPTNRQTEECHERARLFLQRSLHVTNDSPDCTWGIVKIMVPFWAPIIIRGLI